MTFGMALFAVCLLCMFRSYIMQRCAAHGLRRGLFEAAVGSICFASRIGDFDEGGTPKFVATFKSECGACC